MGRGNIGAKIMKWIMKGIGYMVRDKEKEY